MPNALHGGTELCHGKKHKYPSLKWGGAVGAVGELSTPSHPVRLHQDHLGLILGLVLGSYPCQGLPLSPPSLPWLGTQHTLPRPVCSPGTARLINLSRDRSPKDGEQRLER